MIRVLHVEDLPVVRQGIAALLSRHADFSLVGSVGTAGEAIELLENGLECEVAVVDLGLPDRSGLDVIRALRKKLPEAVALAFTIFDEPQRITDALKAGARGYLLKQTPPDALVAALRESIAGGSPMTPSVARKVVESFRIGAREGAPVEAPLTTRELEVLEGLVQGQSYARIGRNLGVSVSTIQTHVRSVYAKLEVNSKAEVTLKAIRQGLVRP
jgi:DNA-binding NarL/FixJ family response regulator